MKIKKRMNHNNYDDTIGLVILLFTISVVPLLVRVTKVNYPTEFISWVKEGHIFLDIYSYVKATTLVILGGLGALILVYKLINKKIDQIKSKTVIIVILSIAVTIMSVLTSDFKYTSIFGMIERFEGALVLISYYVIFLLAYRTNWNKDARDKFFVVFLISNLLLSIIGVLQYFGYDPMMWPFIKPLITSNELISSNFNIDSTVKYRVIGQTLYNYNYVSFFATLSLPIFLTRIVYETNIKIKISCMILSLLILFNLFGSSARGGMVGLAVGLTFWIVLNWKKLFSNLKISVVLLLFVALSFIGFEVISDGFVTKRFLSIFDTKSEEYQIKRVYTEDDNILVMLSNGTLRLETEYGVDNAFSITSYFNDVEILSIIDKDGNFIYENTDLSLISYHFEQFDDDKLILVVVTDGIRWPFINYNDKLYLKNIYGKDIVLKYASSFGFEGNEKAGSARGYIWSRTLPLIFKKPILGYGPDTVALVFPQEDYIGKYYSYGTQNMIVDKTHNIYLQYALNSGVISMILYVTLPMLFVISGIKKFIKDKYEFNSYLLPALLVSIVSYSVAGLFNDSSVHVAPVYWIMLGIGLSLVQSSKEDAAKGLKQV